MKRVILERNIAVILFILVLIVFSFADRDSKKLDQLYKRTESFEPIKKNSNKAASELETQLADNRLTGN
jgi:hypothetical protein